MECSDGQTVRVELYAEQVTSSFLVVNLHPGNYHGISVCCFSRTCGRMGYTQPLMKAIRVSAEVPGQGP